ncbi:MAG: hypothetical protein KJZ93_23475 [Caldilineaceae bacterium]|nr:hypothetical protein [Caldilineaceae bacterium]
MSDLQNDRVKPYAGIEHAQRIGLGVEQCAERVSRFGYAAKQLMFAQAGKMSSVANWEFKAMVGRGLWECAQHWGQWRARIGEMRGHEHLIDRHAEGPLYDLFQELLHSNGDAEFATGLYGVILPAYRAALLRYTGETNPLVDQPTVRLIRHMVLDLDDHLAFGETALAAIEPAHRATAAAWQAHLEQYLAAAGGIDGTSERLPSFQLPPPRSQGDFRIPGDYARDARFATTLPKINPFDNEKVHEPLLSKMWVRSQEMTAAELCATVLFEWDDLPYEGCLDLARHCWDETRHGLFGQAALEAEGIPLETLPSWVGYAKHTMPASPPKRYSHLAIATEAGLMRHPGGKRGEWEWCKDEAKHPLMTTYQDFDWADEVNHVAYGREWLIRYYCKGDRAKAQAMADETVAERLAYYAQFATPADAR